VFATGDVIYYYGSCNVFDYSSDKNKDSKFVVYKSKNKIEQIFKNGEKLIKR